jgi:hypothetical protein
MTPLKLGRADGDGSAQKAERRSREDQRGGPERRKSGDLRDGGRRRVRDLYQSDLDRHLWSWASPAKKKRRKKKAPARRRRVAGLVASAAGALSAAGLFYFLYRRLRKDDRPDDPVHSQADLDEDDFDDS